jgi:hypothetical protein
MSSEPFKAHTTAKVRPIASMIQRTFLTRAESAVELRESHGLKVADLSKAQQRAEEQRDLIIQRWHEHLD